MASRRWAWVRHKRVPAPMERASSTNREDNLHSRGVRAQVDVQGCWDGTGNSCQAKEEKGDTGVHFCGELVVVGKERVSKGTNETS